MRAAASAPMLHAASNVSSQSQSPLAANTVEGSSPPTGDAFKTYPDFSKFNSEIINAHRADTFGTPTSLNAKFHTPSRLERRKAQDEPAEFQRRMLKAVNDLQQMQKEQQRSLETLRKDMANSLDEQTNVRGILVNIQELTGTLEEKSREPLDLSSVLEELQSVRKIASEQQTQMEGRIGQQMKQMVEELHAAQKQREQAEDGRLDQIQEEMLNIRLVPEVKAVVHRSEMQLGEVLGLAQSTSADSARTSCNVQEIQEQQARMIQDIDVLSKESKEHYAHFVPRLQDQLTTFFEDNSMKVDLEEINSQLSQSRSIMRRGFDGMLGEIARVQQALNVDFLAVVDDMQENMRKSVADILVPQLNKLGSTESVGFGLSGLAAAELRRGSLAEAICLRRGMTGAMNTDRRATLSSTGGRPGASPTPSGKVRKRVRNYWSQTDIAETEEMWAQTDDDLWKTLLKPKKNKGRKLGDDRHNPAQRHTQNRTAFQDAERIKKQMRNQLMQPQYNVTDYYWETGCCQKVASSPMFEHWTLLMTLLNVVWIGVDTDLNKSAVLVDAHPVFIVAENLFCSFFTVELLIRFFAFQEKRNCLRDFWFVFDAMLVTVMIGETWLLSLVMLSLENRPSGDLGGLSILRIFRFAKVVKVSRLVKLLRAIPEIVVLLKGITIAIRTVLVFFVVWLVIIFVFAIIFREATDDEDIGRRYFRSVPAAMNTLLLHGLLPDNEPLVNDITDSNWIYWLLMMAFITMASLTLMHMLVGVMVETITIISVVEKESMAVTFVSNELRNILQVVGHDPDRPLTKAEFTRFIMEPGVSRLFRSEGVDTNILVDMTEMIFQDLELTGNPGLAFEQLVEIILNMRGSNPVTKRDVKEQMRLIKSVVRESMDVLHTALSHDLERLKADITAVVEIHDHFDDLSEVLGGDSRQIADVDSLKSQDLTAIDDMQLEELEAS